MKQRALFSVVKNIMIKISVLKEGIITDTDDYYRRKLKILPNIQQRFCCTISELMFKLKTIFKEDKDNINDKPTK